jgi:hypothetical protein
VLRWAVYEAGQTHGRTSAPGHGYYAAVKDRKNGKRAALPGPARSSGRPATSWPSPATTRSPPPDSPHRPMEATPRTRRGPGQERLQPYSPDGEPPRPAPASRLSAAAGSCHHEPGGRPNKTERPHPAGGDTRSNILPPGQHPPRAPRQGWLPSSPAPAATAGHLAQKGQPPEPLTPLRGNPAPPCPAAGMTGSRAGCVKDAYGAGYAGRTPARSWTRPPARRTRQPSGDREQTLVHPKSGQPRPEAPQTNACGHRPIQVRRRRPRFTATPPTAPGICVPGWTRLGTPQ